MTIGGSLFVIALGAILRYAVEDSIKGVDLQTIGLILMLVGLAGLPSGSTSRSPGATRATRSRRATTSPRRLRATEAARGRGWCLPRLNPGLCFA